MDLRPQIRWPSAAISQLVYKDHIRSCSRLVRTGCNNQGDLSVRPCLLHDGVRVALDHARLQSPGKQPWLKTDGTQTDSLSSKCSSRRQCSWRPSQAWRNSLASRAARTAARRQPLSPQFSLSRKWNSCEASPSPSMRMGILSPTWTPTHRPLRSCRRAELDFARHPPTRSLKTFSGTWTTSTRAAYRSEDWRCRRPVRGTF